MSRSLAERQAYAIARAREERRVELAPLRQEVANAIAVLGWRRAGPVVRAVMAPVPVSGLHGGWWSVVGKRNGARLLEALAGVSEPPRQRRFAFEPLVTHPIRTLECQEATR